MCVCVCACAALALPRRVPRALDSGPPQIAAWVSDFTTAPRADDVVGGVAVGAYSLTAFARGGAALGKLPGEWYAPFEVSTVMQ